MSSDDFISKQQFQAVHDHFREVIDTKENELELNNLQTEFRLLLDYFRSIYRQSERKTHKILHLMTEISKDKEKMNEMQKWKDEEREKLAVQLWGTKKKLDELMRKEQVLLKQIDEMKECIENLENVMKEYDILKKYKIFIPNSRNCRDIGVVTTEEHAKDVKYDWEMCKTCSERNSTTVNSMFYELASREKYEEVMAKLNKKVNVLSTELKLSYKDRANLKLFLENSNKRLDDLKCQLEKEKEYGEGIQKDILKKKSLKATIDKLVLDLYSKNCEIRNLQEGLEKEIEKRNTIILENEAKDTVLENMKRKLNSLQESKEFASRKADIFEEHLATDKGRFLSLQHESDSLKEKMKDLNKELRTHETQQKLQMEQQKWLEVSQQTEMTEQKKVIEHCKSQIAMRDKRIRTLTMKMSDTGRQMGVLRKQLKEKAKEKTVLTSELSKVKITVKEQSGSLQSLKANLETMENSNVRLQAELKSMKNQNEVLLREKNKLYCQYKKLYAKFESQEMKNLLLNKQQEYQRNALKVSSNKIEKISKMRRCLSSKY